MPAFRSNARRYTTLLPHSRRTSSVLYFPEVAQTGCAGGDSPVSIPETQTASGFGWAVRQRRRKTLVCTGLLNVKNTVSSQTESVAMCAERILYRQHL